MPFKAPKNMRSLEAIYKSGFVIMNSEAPHVVPVSAPTLWRYYAEGRLRAYGRPMKIDLDHLLHQAKNDYPVLEDQEEKLQA
jgi:hypothetical protein